MNDRPWSPAEVEALIPDVLEQLDDAITGLMSKYRDAAAANYEARKAHSIAWLQVKGRNREEREARVFSFQVVPGGKTVGQLEYDHELAEGIQRSEAQRIRGLQTKADLLRSLLVSARDHAA